MRLPCRLRAWAIVAAAGIFSLGIARAADPAPLPVRELAPGVYVHAGALEDWGPASGEDVANLGFVVGSRCVAVIDTGGSVAIGRRWLATIASVTPLPVCHVINTHVHPDHLLGNAAFAALDPRPEFVGHARLAASLAARERSYLNVLRRDFGVTDDTTALVRPTVSVVDRLDIDLGDRRLTLQAWPTAHTDHDLSVLDQRSRTLFLGDLLFVSHLPVVDGSLRGWLQVMDRLKTQDVALAVPGHGAPSAQWPGALQAQRDYLEHLAREVRAAIKSRQTIQQAVESIAPAVGGGSGGWQLSALFHRRNVTTAYAELEWED